ncbi:MAG: helix-turn-helix transcriptional regulator [Pseudonocardiaceae bacterium]
MVRRMRFARVRKTAGFTQESLAEVLEVDRSTVARWEAGHHEPWPYLRPKLARLLKVSAEELNELLWSTPSVHVDGVVSAVQAEPDDSVSAQAGLLLPVVIDGHPTFLRLDTSALIEQRGWASMDGSLHYVGRLDSTLQAIVGLSGGDLRRRDVLPGVVFTAAAFAEPALFALTAPPVSDVSRQAGSRRIGMTDVKILSDSVAHLRQMDFRYGSRQLRNAAVRLLHQSATTLLHSSYSDLTGRALLTVVAQAARLAASMAADTSRHALAQRYYIQALDLAIKAGDRLFAANMLSDMSRLTIQNATGQRCAHQALALARAGMRVGGKATPTLAAQLSAVEARAHALCGDTSAARSAVLKAERHYERFRPDGEPAWLGFYTEAELAADLGRALRDSAEPTHAAQLMTRTLGGYEPWRVRSRCFVQTDLAAAYLIGGDHEHAAALTRDALSTAIQVSSSRTVSRIRALRQQIRQLRCADLAELDEEITGFLRSHGKRAS